PATTDLISGQIPIASLNVTAQVLELHHAGKVRILAVTTPRRLARAADIPTLPTPPRPPGAPDTPTAVEQGLPGMIAQNFIGLFAPARTPPAIIEQVAQATRGVMDDEAFLPSLP